MCCTYTLMYPESCVVIPLQKYLLVDSICGVEFIAKGGQEGSDTLTVLCTASKQCPGEETKRMLHTTDPYTCNTFIYSMWICVYVQGTTIDLEQAWVSPTPVCSMLSFVCTECTSIHRSQWSWLSWSFVSCVGTATTWTYCPASFHLLHQESTYIQQWNILVWCRQRGREKTAAETQEQRAAALCCFTESNLHH